MIPKKRRENKMACMEFNCTSCNWFSMGNSMGPSCCPKCGARITRHFDEENEMRDDNEKEDDEEDE